MPCVAEMPSLNKLVEDYRGNKEVLFYAVAHNMPQEVTKFLEKRPFTYQQGVFNQNFIEIFGLAYPVNIVINKKGGIVYYKSGYSFNKTSQEVQERKFKEAIRYALME